MGYVIFYPSLMEDLLNKIKKIEALIKGAQTDGERTAATLAKERIQQKLRKEEKAQTKEYSLYTQGNWHKKLLLALCRKHGVVPYRYKRQKYTTVMVNINEAFLNEVLWPEYLEYSKHLEELVEQITDRIIHQIYEDKDEDIIHGRLNS